MAEVATIFGVLFIGILAFFIYQRKKRMKQQSTFTTRAEQEAYNVRMAELKAEEHHRKRRY